MAFGKKPCCDGCARKPSKARISGNPIAHLFQMGGEVMKELESTDPLFIHEDEGYNTAVLSDMLRRDVEFDPEDSYVTRQQLEELLREGVINEEEYLAELAYMPDTPVEEEPYSPTPLELYVEEMTGMEPGLDRATFMPWAGSREEGNFEFAAPALVYELAKALNAPGVALSGEEITPEEVFNTAGLLTGGSFGGSGVRNVLAGEGVGSGLGMASVPPGGIKGFNRPLLRKKYLQDDHKLRLGSPNSTDYKQRRAAAFSDKPTSYDRVGKWERPSHLLPEDPVERRLAGMSDVRWGDAARGSTIDEYMENVALKLDELGIPFETWAPFYNKLQKFLEKDFGTGGDPLRSALFSGSIPATAMSPGRYDSPESELGQLYALLRKTQAGGPEQDLLRIDELRRSPIRNKLKRNQPLDPEEEALWNNPPPVRIEAERLYDKLGMPYPHRLFRTEEAAQNIRKQERETWYNMLRESDPEEVPRPNPAEIAIREGEPVADALVSEVYPTYSYNLPNLAGREGAYIGMGMDIPKWELRSGRDTLRNPGLPTHLSPEEVKLATVQAWERRAETDPTFARALEDPNWMDKDIIWDIDPGIYGSRVPALKDTTVAEIVLGLDPDKIAQASLVDMLGVGHRKLGPALQLKSAGDAVNAAVYKLGKEEFPDYASVDALLHKIDPVIWGQGTTKVLDVPATRSNWVKVDDAEKLYLYGNYLNNSIVGYARLAKKDSYPAWGPYKGPEAVEKGAVEVYALHDNATKGPRLIVQVFKNPENIDPMDYNQQIPFVNQVKGRKGNVDPRQEEVELSGNRPPNSRDVEALFGLFKQLDIPPTNVAWREFSNTIIYAPVDDPLRRAYVRFVDRENDRLVRDMGDVAGGLDPAALLDFNDNTMAMLLERGGSRADTPVELPWIIDPFLPESRFQERSVAHFLEELYATYKGLRSVRYPSDVDIPLAPLQEAAALPEPPITEW